ncbi:MAG: EamA family transporter RarD [Rhizobacter sp.]|nr:EamA family transporter RarD [Rhizobacter sp.]
MNPGVVYATLAFLWWGLFPLYFRIVTTVPAAQILAHRVIWCLVFLAAVLTARRQWGWLPQVLRQPRVLVAFVASALLIGANWLAYIWAVNHGHVLEASLGYFITPMVNVLLGVTLLHERLRRAQWLALVIASAGVLWLTLQAGRPPWIALSIAITFGGYGLLRKIAVLGALEGLTLETMLLAPPALLVLGIATLDGSNSFPAPDALANLWMMALGPITAVPLLFFAAAARRLSMATLGIVQYLGPSIQFGLGVWVFNEPFSAARLIGFGGIWLALLIYTLDGLSFSRAMAPVASPA